LLAPPRRRNPLAWPLLGAVVIAGLLGLHVLTTPTTQTIRVVAATSKPPATARPRASSPQPVAIVPRATPSPSPSPTPVPTALPEVKVPVISRTWLKTHPPAVAPSIKGRAAIVVDLTTGQVLYEQAGTTRSAEASITKLMTAMVAVDLAPLDTTITVSAQATQVEPNLMGLSAGERLTLRELLDGLLLNSGNDAAESDRIRDRGPQPLRRLHEPEGCGVAPARDPFHEPERAGRPESLQHRVRPGGRLGDPARRLPGPPGDRGNEGCDHPGHGDPQGFHPVEHRPAALDLPRGHRAEARLHRRSRLLPGRPRRPAMAGLSWPSCWGARNISRMRPPCSITVSRTR